MHLSDTVPVSMCKGVGWKLYYDAYRTLSLADKNSLYTGQWLSDQHMNFIQALLKEQFPYIAGLRNTLSLNSAHVKSSLKGHSLQIIFCRGNHWLVACTVNSVPNVVTIYTSLHRDGAMDHLHIRPKEFHTHYITSGSSCAAILHIEKIGKISIPFI